MTLKIKTLALGAGILALAACGEGPAGKTWNQEAGAFIDEGGFGNPTMINMMAQMCAQGGKGGFKSGGVVDPVVVRDPNSSAAKPVYYRDHTQCAGQLNGKYAEVIFREYVVSAEPASTGNELISVDSE